METLADRAARHPALEVPVGGNAGRAGPLTRVSSQTARDAAAARLHATAWLAAAARLAANRERHSPGPPCTDDVLVVGE